jgi:hypothetical protein
MIGGRNTIISLVDIHRKQSDALELELELSLPLLGTDRQCSPVDGIRVSK